MDTAPAAEAECLSNNLGWLLGSAEHVLAAELGLALEPLGLSSRRYCVLATALGQDRTQIELANLIGLDKTTMVATIDALEEAGLAERVTFYEEPSPALAEALRAIPPGAVTVTRFSFFQGLEADVTVTHEIPA